MITIKTNINEKDFIEGLLNSKYSGGPEKYTVLFLGLYAMGKSWHYNKFIYYLGLLEVVRR